MPATSIAENMSPELLKVTERAKQEPAFRFSSVAHLINEVALARAYHRLRKDAAVGVDGITVEQYGQDLEENLKDLHQRMKAMQYRHQPIRRVHIPKEKGKTRPIGIATVEDKVVQGALTEVLEAIYEPGFLPCSYGFRRGRSAHDAIRELDLVVNRGDVSWVLEADIMSFFDSVDRTVLKEMLQRRVADGSMMRLIGKCLHVGVLDGEEYAEPETGTAQGSILSPLLGNIYLHNVLDVWFEEEVKPRLTGRATLIRYADDFVIGFEREDDAKRVMAVIGQRMTKYGLTLHPEKTRLLHFGRPSKTQTSGKGPGTFDFLGFTLHWRKSLAGRWYMACQTRGARLRRAIQAVYDWCRSHRHEPLEEQHRALSRRIQGHINYFGVSGNSSAMRKLIYRVRRAWFKWLKRRSQKSRLNWERFVAIERKFPLPRPRIMVHLWARAST
jgi:group II intron reverse transcriptase/maturase